MGKNGRRLVEEKYSAKKMAEDMVRLYGKVLMKEFKARKAVFQKLEDIVDIASLSKEDRMKYDESIKVYRDNLVTRAAAIEEGKKEANIATARNMKADGLPVDFIVKYTGLTAEEIEAL